jgi:hypothetical protein
MGVWTRGEQVAGNQRRHGKVSITLQMLLRVRVSGRGSVSGQSNLGARNEEEAHCDQNSRDGGLAVVE